MHLTQSRLSGFDTGVISYNPGKNNKDREKNNTDLIDDDFLSSRTPSGSISKVFSSISEKFM